MQHVTEEQLAKGREIKAKQQAIQMELGGLYVTQEDIKVRQNKLVEDLRNSGNEIQEFMNTLAEEYGQGSLNLETGEFTVGEQVTE